MMVAVVLCCGDGGCCAVVVLVWWYGWCLCYGVSVMKGWWMNGWLHR